MSLLRGLLAIPPLLLKLFHCTVTSAVIYQRKDTQPIQETKHHQHRRCRSPSKIWWIFFTCRTTVSTPATRMHVFPSWMGPTSTLSQAPKYPELGTFSNSCSERFLGKLASSGSEHPPGRVEFEIWPSQQPREVFQPLSCYISIHHHIPPRKLFLSVSWWKWRTLIYSLDREMPEGFHAPHFRHSFTLTSPVKAPVTSRVCNSAVSFLHVFWHLKQHFRSPAPFSSVLFCSINHNEVPNFLHRN